MSCRWETHRAGRRVSKASATTKKESGLNTWEQTLAHRNTGQLRTSLPLPSSPSCSNLGRGGIEVGMGKEENKGPLPFVSLPAADPSWKRVRTLTTKPRLMFCLWQGTVVGILITNQGLLLQRHQKSHGICLSYYPGARGRTGHEEIKLMFLSHSEQTMLTI